MCSSVNTEIYVSNTVNDVTEQSRRIIRIFYCLLHQRMQFNCTAWAQSLNTRDYGRGTTYRSCQTHEFVSLHDLLSTGRHWLSAQFVTKLYSNIRTALTINENDCIMSHVEKKSALGQWNTSVTGHIAGRVGSSQHTNLPRSTAHSSVSMSRTISSSGLASSLAYLNILQHSAVSRN